MSKAPIMPFFTDAYLADCHHLTTEAHGALLLILLHTWRQNGQPLPDDDRVLMRIVKATSATKWKRLRREIAPLFDLSGGHWRQKRLERTWANVSQKIEQNRENGKRKHRAVNADKPLKTNEAASANAAVSLLPTINQQSNTHKPKPTDTKKEDDMILASTHPAPALESLMPLLKDARYFVPRSNVRVAPSMKPQIEQALTEAQSMLAPASPQQLQKTIARLMMHFPCPAGEKERVFSDYADCLHEFPEDLIARAYQHVLRHHKYHTLPKIADFIAVIEPEMTARRTNKRKLDMLLAQVEADT